MFIVIVVSVRSLEVRRLSMKFSRRTRFVVGSLVSRMGAFHSNHAVNPFSHASASVMDMSLVRDPFGFSVLSKRWGPGGCRGGVWGSGHRMFLALSPGCSYSSLSTYVKGGVWLSDADSDEDADGDPDGVHECRCRWSSTCTVSHVGSLNPRMRFAQQKSWVETSGVGSSLRNRSMASPERIQVVLSGAM